MIIFFPYWWLFYNKLFFLSRGKLKAQGLISFMKSLMENPFPYSPYILERYQNALFRW